MIKYGFNFLELKTRKDHLEDILTNNSLILSDDEKQEIEKSIDVCNSLLDYGSSGQDLHSDYDDYSNNFDLVTEMKQYVYNDDYDDKSKLVRDAVCKKIHKLQLSCDINIDFNQNLNLSNYECVQLVGDMIRKKLGMNHYNVYKNMFINNPTHVDFSDTYDSCIYSISNIDDSYVIIKNKSDISKASDLAHEAGHYFARVNCNNYIDTCTNIDEVESTFYEMMFMQFLMEENIYVDDAHRLFLELLDEAVCERASIIHALYSYPMYKINSVKDFKIMANKYGLFERTNSYSTNDLLKWININIEENAFTYTYSTLVALELFNEYMNTRNKKNVINKFEKFVSQIGLTPDFKLASFINSDFISFNDFNNLKKYYKRYHNMITIKK